MSDFGDDAGNSFMEVAKDGIRHLLRESEYKRRQQQEIAGGGKDETNLNASNAKAEPQELGAEQPIAPANEVASDLPAQSSTFPTEQLGEVELDDFSWKEDLIGRATLAKNGVHDLNELKASCEKYGITLDKTADGKELLYKDKEKPWLNVRGDTLGKGFGIDSFQRSLKVHKARIDSYTKTQRKEPDLARFERASKSR